jgi:hypothetical protein
MEKNNNQQVQQIKQYIFNLVSEKLQNFELVNGGMQRTVADLIESKVCDILLSSESNLISEKRGPRSKKSIEDVSLISNGTTYYVDPKTHNIKSKFSMPNLTAVEKIKNLFSSQKEDLIYVFVSYFIQNNIVIIDSIKVFFIWELDISILGVGALGKGQLQIKNAHNEIIFTNKCKTEWYSDFKILVQDFLKRQIKKINKQIIKWQ